MDADLAVIGGGPVGLAAAIEARLAGLDVIVIEPRPAPIDKACGEGLMPGAVRALERLGVDPAGWPLRGVAYVAGERRAEHGFGSGPGRGVRRTVLHAALAARARELGSRLVRGRVEGVDQRDGAVRLQGEGFGELRVPWAVASDGLHSRVRRLVGVESSAGRRARRRFGLRRHFSVAPWGELIEVHWSDSSGPAFEAYVTPVGEREVGIALLGSPGLEFETALARLPELAERLQDAAPSGDVRGAGPLRQRVRRRVAGRVVLAGDASGYVDALTGEGLRVGFEHARAAVRAVAAGDASGYERDWRRATRDYRVLTGGLLRMSHSPLRARIVPIADRLPRVYGAIVERLAR